MKIRSPNIEFCCQEDQGTKQILVGNKKRQLTWGLLYQHQLIFCKMWVNKSGEDEDFGQEASENEENEEIDDQERIVIGK